MRHEFEKKMHIISDLLAYGNARGADELEMSILKKEDRTIFTVRARPTTLTEQDLEKLLGDLNAPRQHEVEQNYWGLSGESQSYSELTLVGMMSDEAQVSYDGRTLTIILERYL